MCLPAPLAGQIKQLSIIPQWERTDRAAPLSSSPLLSCPVLSHPVPCNILCTDSRKKFDQREGLPKHMAVTLQEAVPPTEQHGEACLYIENVCIYLYQSTTSTSIYNLVCLCSECLAWVKHQSVPRVHEDHCVNGPHTAHSRVTLFKYRHQLLNAST